MRSVCPVGKGDLRMDSREHPPFRMDGFRAEEEQWAERPVVVPTRRGWIQKKNEVLSVAPNAAEQ